MPICEQCGAAFDAGTGAWDDGDYLCAECIQQHLLETQQVTFGPPRLMTEPGVPEKTVTYRICGLDRAQVVAKGLINHGQWFTFGRCASDTPSTMEYQFILDAATPVTGYNFEPTNDVAKFALSNEYGLLVA
jgi:hypothetical protein